MVFYYTCLLCNARFFILVGVLMGRLQWLTNFQIRNHLCLESDRKDIFEWVIRSMISCGHSARMSSFLEENGIKKEEIEAASVQPEGILPHFIYLYFLYIS